MVHPITEGMYREAHVDYRAGTEDFGRMRFDEDTKNNPKQYRIDQLYRIKHVDKDYIVYNQTVVSSDFPGNTTTCPELVGTHEEPRFQKQYDAASGRPKPVAVSGSEVKYDIEATKENIQSILNGIVLEGNVHVYKKKVGEQVDIVPHNTNFVLSNGNAKYGDFTADEFINKHFDDLLYKATHGEYPEKARPFGYSEKPRAVQGFTGIIEQPSKNLLTTAEKSLTIKSDIVEQPEETTKQEKPKRQARKQKRE